MGRIHRRPLLINLRCLLERIPFRPLDVNCLYFLEYVGIPPRHANLLRGHAALRKATLQDLEGLTKCQNSPRAFRDRFKANDHCAVAVLDGCIVGYQWFCDKPLYEEERYGYQIEIPPDAIYAYDIFILPEYRLAGLWFRFHCLYVRDLMQRLHRQRIIGMVDYGNRLSMNTHLRFGFRLVRRVFVIKMFGLVVFTRASAPGEKVDLPRWISACGNAGRQASKRPECCPAPATAESGSTEATIGSVHPPNAPSAT
jgi:GNAT superfamily N-acetyltransferase